MKNAWTGGQYSLYRATLGAYLLAHFVSLIPQSGEFFPTDGSPLLRFFPNILAFAGVAMPLLTAASIAAVLFAIGLFDRVAAVLMGYVLACLFAHTPQLANPSLQYLGWLLLIHALLPPAPYGSWTARKRVDPRGGWTMPPAIFAAAWIAMSLGYMFTGWTKLASGSWVGGALELLYAPLALFRRARPWIWTAMLVLHLALMIIDVDLSLGMVILHFFTFDPAWIRGREAEVTDTVFYDGTCGLCHRSVRFILAEDRRGTAFTFSPLGSERFLADIGDRPDLPDSVIVFTADRTVLMKSDAFIRILNRLGGLWRVIGILFSLIPRSLRDVAYDFIARIRYRLFGRAKDACPLLPPDLRARFSA